MSGFSPEQLKKLLKRLDSTRVQSREINGRRIDYIEGWFAIAEANAIFGYAGWDREMVHFDRVFERVQSRGTDCAYVARVRVRVRAGDRVIIREGTGFGHGFASYSADAHERALKTAETDATKRALATFGNRFGLSLYDKDQGATVRAPKHSAEGQSSGSVAQPWASLSVGNTFELKTDDGTVLAAQLSPEGFCSGLRQLTEGATTASELEGLKANNSEALALLRTTVPQLKNAQGKHYADILDALTEKHRRALMVATTAGYKSEEPRTPVSPESVLPAPVLPAPILSAAPPRQPAIPPALASGTTDEFRDQEPKTAMSSAPAPSMLQAAIAPALSTAIEPDCEDQEPKTVISLSAAPQAKILTPLAIATTDDSQDEDPRTARPTGPVFAATPTLIPPADPAISQELIAKESPLLGEATKASLAPMIAVRPGDPIAAEKPLLGEQVKTSRIGRGAAINKSVLTLASPRRIRNKAHLARVAAEPCLICEQGPAHAHHVTFAQPRGLSVKVSDEFTVPLCALHHNDLHRARNEAAWWRQAGIDPLAAACALWEETLAVTVP